MYRVVSLDVNETIFCLRIHYKSRTLKDCWAFVDSNPTESFYVLDKADQFCDLPATGSEKEPVGGCVLYTAGNNINLTNFLGGATT